MHYSLDQYHLHVTLTSKECPIPEQIRMQLQDWLDRLGKTVQEFASSDLTINVIYHPKSDIYHAEAKLKVPGQTITTGDYEKSIEEAMKRCLDKAVRRVAAYRLNPDREALEQAERRAHLDDVVKASPEPDVGQIGEAVKNQDYQAFRTLLGTHDTFVRMRVGRWVQRYPEIQQEVGRSFEIGDMVEEVFLIAFDKYAERPPHFGMQEWLESLIDPAVKAYFYNPEEREAVSYAQSLVGPT